MASSQCSIETCKQPAVLLCRTCNNDLCHDHLKEHDNWLISEATNLVKEMKTVSKRYEKLDKNKLANEFRQKLDKWREESYKTIDRIYQEKRREFDEDWTVKLIKPKKDIDKMQSILDEFIRKNKVTHNGVDQSRKSIRYINHEIKQIEEKGIQINIPDLVVNSSTPNIEDFTLDEMDAFQLEPAYRSINCSAQSGVAFATNTKNILIYESDHLNLFNKELIFVQQGPWTFGHIHDMCWCATLNSFIILTDRRIAYRLDENSLSLTSIQSIPPEKWWSCTCSEKTLFLSTYGADAKVFQFNLSPSLDLIKQWRPPETCKQYETIHDISYGHETLGLTISDPSTNMARLELRSSTTLTQHWSFTLNISDIPYHPTIHCCQIRYGEWIIILENISRIFHISHDGKLKRVFTYKPCPWNALVFDSNSLVIRTEHHLLLHNM